MSRQVFFFNKAEKNRGGGIFFKIFIQGRAKLSGGGLSYLARACEKRFPLLFGEIGKSEVVSSEKEPWEIVVLKVQNSLS